MKPVLFSIALLILCTVFFPARAVAQGRDYFTPEEIELIRDAQEIDGRIDVLIKAIDRRFAVLKIDVSGSKAAGKEWGELPTGTRTELFSDIRNILQKAIDDIDNLAERPDSAPVPDKDDKKAKSPAALFNKAVRNLAAGARRYESGLKPALDTAASERERGLIAGSIDLCDQIVEAVQKLPGEALKKNEKKH